MTDEVHPLSSDPPSLVEWFNDLMKDENELRRMKELVALAARSHGDAEIELGDPQCRTR